MEFRNRPTLNFYQENGHQAALLAVGDEPFLNLSKATSDERVTLAATKGVCGLGVYDRSIRAGLSVQNGVAGLALFDENGKRTGAIGGQSTTGPSLNLNDPEGEAGFTFWVAPPGIGPDFSTYNGAGNLGVGITDLVQTGPSLKLFHRPATPPPSGVPIWFNRARARTTRLPPLRSFCSASAARFYGLRGELA